MPNQFMNRVTIKDGGRRQGSHWRMSTWSVLLGIVLLVFCLSLLTPLSGANHVSAASGVLYVDADAAGANNGTSWADAFVDLQDALAVAVSGDEIWVAEGLYKPTIGADPSVSFQLTDGVALYGGFAGTETMLDQRDWNANSTLLSGDLGGINSFHVVTASHVYTGTILDGFIVTAGRAEDFSHRDGAGMHIADSLLTIANTSVVDNQSFGKGGGIYVTNSTLTIVNTNIDDNSSWDDGAGIHSHNSNPNISYTTFANNYSDGNGAGIYIEGGSPIIYQVSFINNTAYWYDGGGVYIAANSSPVLRELVFDGNSAYSGGGIFNASHNLIFTDMSFVDNAAAYAHGAAGGGIYNSGNGVTIKDVSFISNVSSAGGGIANGGQDVIVYNAHFENGVANDYGGGVSNWGTLSAYNVEFLNNYAAKAGGGINNSGSLTVVNATFVHNFVYDIGGGAVFNWGDWLIMSNVTLTENRAGHQHGSNAQGGGIVNHQGTLSLANSIVWNNSDNDPNGTVSSAQISGSANVNYSIVQGGVQAGWGGGGNLSTDPLFQDPSNGDYRLGATSPAIDAGKNRFVLMDVPDLDGDGDVSETVPIDLDGNPRVVEHPMVNTGSSGVLAVVVDMGAYEAVAPVVVNEMLSVQYTTNYDANTQIYTINATWTANISPYVVQEAVSAPFIKIAELSGPGCPCYVTDHLGQTGGVGAEFPAEWVGDLDDGILMPGETFSHQLDVHLTNPEQFTFFVDVWGVWFAAYMP